MSSNCPRHHPSCLNHGAMMMELQSLTNAGITIRKYLIRNAYKIIIIMIMLAIMFNHCNQMTAFWLTLIIGVTAQIVMFMAYMKRMAILRRARFKKGEVVNCLLKGSTFWVEGVITEVYDVKKYSVRITESKLSPQIREFLSNHPDQTAGLAQIRKRVHEPMTNRKQNNQATGRGNTANKQPICGRNTASDWYLDGRDCKEQYQVLMAGLMEIYKSIEFETVWIPSIREKYQYSAQSSARFVALETLQFLYSPQIRWTVYCFRCNELRGNDQKVKMNRDRSRSLIMRDGTGPAEIPQVIFEAKLGLQISLFCDDCLKNLDCADYVYRCDNQIHDICIQCLKKRADEKERIREIIQDADSPLDSDCTTCLVEYIVGEFHCFTEHI